MGLEFGVEALRRVLDSRDLLRDADSRYPKMRPDESAAVPPVTCHEGVFQSRACSGRDENRIAKQRNERNMGQAMR